MLKFFTAVVVALAIALVPSAGLAGIRSKSKEVKKAKVAKKSAKVKSKELARIERDVQRLEALLAGVKTKAKLSDKSWKSVANEANTLANRIHANVKSATSERIPLRAADELRDHVQEMKKEAQSGDYRSTRRAAERALSVAYMLDEWAS